MVMLQKYFKLNTVFRKVNLVMLKKIIFLSIFFCCNVVSQAQGSNPFPNKIITIVVPYPPGGTADIIGRLLAEQLALKTKASVVVQNKGGAAGNIAAQFVKSSAPDGYTLILGNAPILAINPHLFKNPGFDPISDFEPIALVADVPLFLVTNPKAPYKTIKEFVAWMKDNPKLATYASGSSGSTTNLAMIMFMKQANFKSLEIPYKGSGPAITAVIANEVPVMFELLPSSMSFVKGGLLNAIAVTSPKRQVNFPMIPTVAESGFPNYEVSSWFGVLAPAGTPKPIVNYLSNAITECFEDPKVKMRLLELGAVPTEARPDKFSQIIKSELGKWGDIIRTSGAKIE